MPATDFFAMQTSLSRSGFVLRCSVTLAFHSAKPWAPLIVDLRDEQVSRLPIYINNFSLEAL